MALSNASTVSADSNGNPPINTCDQVLSRISLSFHEAKAVQILRLLKDQEELNKRFQKTSIDEQVNNSDSDNSLSDNSLKETEKRLAQRLSVHKQKGGRSKTSLEFYNDKNCVSNSSSEEDELKMADESRIVNTRINRPKSSYVRRRHLPTEEADDNSHVESAPQRRCRSTRPPSRIGNRDIDASIRECVDYSESEPKKMVLKETTYNYQAPSVSPSNEFVDPIGYDRYAHTKTPVPSVGTGIRRERTSLRSFNTNTEAENIETSHISKAQYEKQLRSRNREGTMSDLSPKRRHRRQQFNNARASRPASENVYLVRQRTEARLLKNGNSTSNANNRPKSDRLVMTANGPKPIISIDHNPISSVTYQKNSVQSQNSPKLDYKSATRPMSRPISRKGRPPQDLSNRNSGVISTRQPLSLMKLPPLESTVSQRTDRLVLTTARETCV